MKKLVVKVANPVRVVINSTKGDWAQIRSGLNSRVLHTGRVAYIKRVAKNRYNTLVK